MDIVERLRKLVILDEVGSDNPLGREAADEIERLREALKQYRDGHYSGYVTLPCNFLLRIPL